jgi:hypothetical protein
VNWRIAVAKRGTYCDAAVPDGSYLGAHPCLVKKGIRRTRNGWFCKRHRKSSAYK